jgi:predicted RNA-binding protein with PIN domain
VIRGATVAGVTLVVVDGNNVIGARPDGWWRDRPAAARRLLDRLRAYAAAQPGPVVLVLDVPQDDVPEGDNGGVTVVYPGRRGRDAADDRIVALLHEWAAAGAPGPEGVEVITSDRALSARAAERGAQVTGARSFLARLDASGA